MEFYLFVLLNAVLFLRPEEILPSLAGYRLYLLTIIPCTLTALPKVLNLLTAIELSRRPITCCVLLYLLAYFCSLVVRGQVDAALDSGGEFAKVVLYYLLTVAILDTPERLRAFLALLGVLATALAAIALLDFHGYVRIEAITHASQGYYNPETGQQETVLRLSGAGMFGDPNDICLLLVVGGCACLYRAATAGNGIKRLLWVCPFGVFGLAFVSTLSRGGMLALLAAIFGGFQARYGLRKAWLPVLAVVPVVLSLVGGRQSDIGTGDTARERMLLWSYGLSEVFKGPFQFAFGIGADQYAEYCGQVAHNSFIHAYVELGVFGGTFFLMAFWTAYRFAATAPPAEQPWAGPFQRYLLPIVLGYAAGAYSLSRCYILPTFLVLALAEAFAVAAGVRVPRYSTVDGDWFRRVAVIGICGLIFLKLFTQIAMVGL